MIDLICIASFLFLRICFHAFLGTLPLLLLLPLRTTYLIRLLRCCTPQPQSLALKVWIERQQRLSSEWINVIGITDLMMRRDFPSNIWRIWCKFLKAHYIYICHIIVPIGALLKGKLGRIVLIRNGQCLASVALPYLFPAQNHYLEKLCIPMNNSWESLVLYL